ncbi:Hypothetical_protein [Hexamita inflata]|uniref:Hypothetical_protein n=1 Tax=Hexamita inflata TaxID=28002 RepID=A0AA86NM38_9EUKA|nr:Hypothetical protein HINF_LOCUS9673 [Hexamita inflata]
MQPNGYAYEIVLEVLNLVQKATRIRRLKVERTVSAENPSVVRKIVTSKYKSTLTALCNQIVSMAYQNHTIRLFYADTICQNVFSGLSMILGLIVILKTVRLLMKRQLISRRSLNASSNRRQLYLAFDHRIFAKTFLNSYVTVITLIRQYKKVICTRGSYSIC